MNEEKVFQTLQSHLPPSALPYCFALWKNHPFELKITKTRQSKVGDFTGRRGAKYQRITLNHDLNPYLFLTTYIHEVAHLHVFVSMGPKVDPHGDEWKKVFQHLMGPLLAKDVYPQQLLEVLYKHMQSPKASSFADVELTKAFRLYDKNAADHAALSDIPEGSIFQFQKRYFQKGKLKRTRVLCKEIRSKRNYLIPAEVLVTNVQLSML
jgi:SprT protein